MRKKYNKLKKKIIAGAAGSALAGALIFGAGTAWADSIDQSSNRPVKQSAMHVMRNWNSAGRIAGLARGIGIDPEEFRREMKSGKTPKQILLENGIDTSDLGKIA